MDHTLAPDIEAVFTKPDAPCSDWETFRWLFFEPSLLHEYTLQLGRREAALRVFRVYVKYIAPLVLLLWLLEVSALAWFHAPAEWLKVDADTWNNLADFAGRWVYLSKEWAFGLAFGLAVGLAVGLAFGLAVGLAVGLAGGLAFGLAFGLAVGLAVGLAYGLAFGLAYGLAFGLAVGLAFGLAVGLAFGLAFGLGFYIGQLRLLFYPFYLGGVFRRQTLVRNPYLRDEGIWLPMPWVERDLLAHAREEPALGLRFARFLFRYRPLQRGLAFDIEHTAAAGLWQRARRLEAALLEELPYFLDDNFYRPRPERTFIQRLSDAINQPRVADARRRLPSPVWKDLLFELHGALLSAEEVTALVLRRQALESAAGLLKKLEAVHLREQFSGREAYFPVFEHWQRLLKDRIEALEAEIERTQTVPLNPYSRGKALHPDVPNARQILLEREDLKAELALKIQTSTEMPAFLLLGQRRVGKTSLLNFLPVLLDRTRFRLAVLDAQGLSGERSVPVWLRLWGEQGCRALDLQAQDLPKLPEDWLEAWDTVSGFLLEKAQALRCKLILCLEEYDETYGLHWALQQDEARAAQLLARMRAFLQRQNDVVMMFVGATGFGDLPGEPRWTKYFVHLHILYMDYLSREGSLRLITRPIPDFRLRYAEGLPERIWELTQGHPHLLHSICSDLVDYANRTAKNPVGEEALEFVLNERILKEGEQPFAVFWDEFCRESDMKQAVRDLAHGREVDASSRAGCRLLSYKYAVQDPKTSAIRLRVPLFEEWVRRFGR